jgi:hypothetical protein
VFCISCGEDLFAKMLSRIMIEYFILLCVEGVRPKLVMILILYYRLVDSVRICIIGLGYH